MCHTGWIKTKSKLQCEILSVMPTSNLAEKDLFHAFNIIYLGNKKFPILKKHRFTNVYKSFPFL